MVVPNIDQSLEGTMHYISPEQTGRINRTVDHRTDFYSLGISFFHFAAGELPYSSTETLELLHKHLAAEIPLLHKVNPKIPVLFSRIVAKLMAKNPDDRYQSASGILADLSTLRDVVAGKAPDLDQQNHQLDQLNLESTLQIPDKLYGRDEEVERLENSFYDLKNRGKSLILITGRSGTGKTALALKLKEIALKRGSRFLAGKFDQLQKSIPYSALVSGLQTHIDELLLEDDEKILESKNRIKKAVGRFGKILVDILPNIEAFTGKKDELPVLNGVESQNRFNNAFSRFIRGLGTTERPVIFFIDDLQWADLGSITILQNLLQDIANKEVLIVGTYRANEVHEAHPLRVMLRALRENDLEPEEIQLEELTEDDVFNLCNDCFPNTENIQDLSHLIYQKTNGNPFFTNQMLKGLYEEGTIFFDAVSRKWNWIVDKIKSAATSNNVVEYMTSQLAKLSPEASYALRLASCIGNDFERKLLENIITVTPDELDIGLDEALINGLIVKKSSEKSNRSYRFAHDRIQQASYENIDEDKRNQIHLKIGRTILNIVPKEQLEERHFDIVDQMNYGIDFVTEEKEKLTLLDLNISAAQKARNSAAFDIGLKYALTGEKLLSKNHWQNDYKKGLLLNNEIAENAFLKTDFEKAHSYIEIIIKNAKTVLDSEVAYKLSVLAYHAQNELLKSIYVGLDFLEKLDIRLPKNPSKAGVVGAFLSARWAIRNETTSSLLNKPLMTDPHKLAAIRMLSYLNAPTYIGLPNLNAILIMEQVKLSVKYGNTPASSSGYGGYGLVLCGLTGEMEQGAKFGQLAQDIVAKYDATEEFSKAHLISNVFVRHWTMPIPESQVTTAEIYQKGVEVGDYVFAAYGAEVFCFMHLFAGTPLPQIREEVDAYDHAVWNIINQENTALSVSSIRQTIDHLQDPDYNSGKLKGNFFDYDSSFQTQIITNDQNGIFKAAVYQIMMYYHFDKNDAAAETIVTAKKYKDAGIALFHIGAFYFYNSLIIITRLPKMTYAQKLIALADLTLSIQKVKWYKKHAPFSYENKYALIMAEKNRYLKKEQKAKTYYEKAISLAGKYNLIHERALACELYAQYLDELGSQELFNYFLKKAFYNYDVYGAKSKITFLKEKYAGKIVEPEVVNSYGRDSSSGSLTSSNLDMITIYKASQVISGAIILEEFLAKMMSLLLENAGADKGWFLIKTNNEWSIKAQKEISENDEPIEVNPLSEMPESKHPLSLKIIQYAERTNKPIVLSDASAHGKFIQDKVIRRLGSRSVFCSPIINQGKTLGMIYLVNDLMTNAFTEQRVALLNLLSSQLAISLQNAMLYDSLETQVKERTADLEKEKELSEKLLRNILPDKIAEELKNEGAVEAKYYKQVSVLFCDFKNFTRLTETVGPKKLVEELDRLFSKFDEISNQFDVEKIKTIGDSYMAATGIPTPGVDNEVKIIYAAQAMAAHLEEIKQLRIAEGSDFYFEARFGIHTGPVIAGVVGKNKFAYDIWGGTVNLASRMESNSEPGKINISGTTFEIVKDVFNCEYRGKISAKNLGEVDMYFVN